MGQSAAKKLVYSELRKALPARLPAFLRKERWFGGKARAIAGTEIADIVPMQGGGLEALLLVIRVRYAEGADENYALPVVIKPQAESGDSEHEALLLTIHDDESGTNTLVLNAMSDAEFLSLLLEMIEREDIFPGEHGELRGVRGKEFSRLYTASASRAQPRVLAGEQSNTSVIYDERLILKFFRRVEEGVNPELEIGAFLTAKAHFSRVPQLAGHLEYREPLGTVTQGILQSFVPNQGDAWRRIQKSLVKFYEAVTKQKREGPAEGLLLGARGGSRADQQITEFVRPLVEDDLAAAALLGKRTAELHRALATKTESPAFAAEPFTMEFQAELLGSLLELTRSTLNLLREKKARLPVEWQASANEIARREKEIGDVFRAILTEPIHAARTRIHGDYHLGQVLYTGSDFVIIDFEGEPARRLFERRAKRSPLQDVAGMMRSFEYAAFAPLLGAVGDQSSDVEELKRLTPWAGAWSSWFTARFLSEYFHTSADAVYMPPSGDETNKLLKVHVLEKAVYELSYELNNRPKWVGIPLRGIAGLLSA